MNLVAVLDNYSLSTVTCLYLVMMKLGVKFTLASYQHFLGTRPTFNFAESISYKIEEIALHITQNAYQTS
jgi:hypothetical protein